MILEENIAITFQSASNVSVRDPITSLKSMHGSVGVCSKRCLSELDGALLNFSLLHSFSLGLLDFDLQNL